jgi:hypothetical protein
LSHFLKKALSETKELKPGKSHPELTSEAIKDIKELLRLVFGKWAK